MNKCSWGYCSKGHSSLIMRCEKIRHASDIKCSRFFISMFMMKLYVNHYTKAMISMQWMSAFEKTHKKKWILNANVAICISNCWESITVLIYLWQWVQRASTVDQHDKKRVSKAAEVRLFSYMYMYVSKNAFNIESIFPLYFRIHFM